MNFPLALVAPSGATFTLIDVDGVPSLVARYPDGRPAWSIGAYGATGDAPRAPECSLVLYNRDGAPVLSAGVTDDSTGAGSLTIHGADGCSRVEIEVLGDRGQVLVLEGGADPRTL